MSPAATIRLAIAGTRTDAVRVTLTAVAAAAAVLAWLAAATVASLGFRGSDLGTAGNNLRYRPDLLQQPGLRPGVVVTLVLLTVPVLAFAAQCARLGAPARDRRLAAYRLAGATPRQAVWLAGAETGVAAVAGSAVGLVVYVVLRSLLDHPDANGQLLVPADVLPPLWSIVLISAGLPVLASLAAAWLMRKVIITPLGVVRRVRRDRAPRPWPGVMVAIALLIFGLYNPLMEAADRHHWHSPAWLRNAAWLTPTILFGGAFAAMLGVCFSAGWFGYSAGRLMRRFGGRASIQLAGARLVDDPWSTSRSMAVILVATVFGGGAAAFYSYTETQDRVSTAQSIAQNPDIPPDQLLGNVNPFYVNTLKLIALAITIALVIAALGQLVSIVEALVSRRRAYACLVATGVPRATLARTAVWQALAGATPPVIFGTIVGVGAMRLFSGTTISESSWGDGVRAVTTTMHVPWPWPQMGLTVGVALAAVLATTSIGMMFIKPSTSVEELRTA